MPNNNVTVQALRDIDLPRPFKKGETREFTKQEARVLYAMKLVKVVIPKKAADKQ
jgi:hypothetical protein